MLYDKYVAFCEDCMSGNLTRFVHAITLDIKSLRWQNNFYEGSYDGVECEKGSAVAETHQSHKVF